MAKRRNLYVLALIAVIVVVVLLAGLRRGRDIPTSQVKHGEFVISITRSGEIMALRSMTVIAPTIGQKLLITRLIPEGTQVSEGDLLIQFDPTEVLDDLESAKRDLAAVRAEMELTQAKNDLRARELEEEIRRREITLRQAQGGSPLEVENAQRDLDLARMRYATEMKVMEAEDVKTKVDIGRAEERILAAQNRLKDLSVVAPGDGIVIHEKVWRGGRQVKVQEGDSPWPMQPLISLPDLNTLYVATDIDEVDISRIEVGLPCRLTLEAYPDTSYDGHVVRIGTLARSKYATGGPNVFDVSVEPDSVDSRFRPGMKAKVEIIIEVLEDKVFVPIEGVFEKDGTPVVYVRDGNSFRERQVGVGKRNDTHILVRSGLEGNEEIALLDPTEKGEE